MRKSFTRFTLTALAVLGLVALSAGPGFAEIAQGDDAPEIEGKEFFNTEQFTYAELSGRLIFVEFFATW